MEGLVVFMLFVFLPGAFIFRFIKSRIPKYSPAKMEEWRKTIPAQFQYPYYLDGTGYAIDINDKSIYLQDGNNHKIYNISQIRDVSWSISGHESMYYTGTSVGVGINVGLQNRANKKHAYKDSGIFITVADIDHPKWQIRFSDEKLLNRNMEILTQFMEGNLKAN